MNILFITDSYYPKPSPNALCVERLKSEFESRGISTKVIALKNFHQIAENTDADVKFVEPDIMYSEWFRACENNNERKKKNLIKAFRLRGILNGFFWPLSSTTHIRRYYKAIKEALASGDKDTIIIGVYKSLEGAVAGALAKKRLKTGKYILYSLDAISGSVIPHIYGNENIGRCSIKRWEKFLFDAYDYIYLLNSHSYYYSAAEYDSYRYKIRFVDIPLLALKENSIEQKKQSDKKKHLVFTGSMAISTADPRYFLELINAIGRDDIVVDFYGKIFQNEILEKIQASPYAKYHGPKSHDEIIRIQQQADILLNFGNFTPCGIPCKIFEYFSTGRPVLSCYKIDADASKPYMERYPTSFLIDERCAIEKNAERLDHFLETPLCYVDSDQILELFRLNTPEATVDQIFSIYNESQK